MRARAENQHRPLVQARIPRSPRALRDNVGTLPPVSHNHTPTATLFGTGSAGSAERIGDADSGVVLAVAQVF